MNQVTKKVRQSDVGESVIVVFNQMMCLFLMIALGYGASKWKIVSSEMSSGLSAMVVKITCPAMVLASVMTAKPEGTMKDIFMVFLLSVAMYIIFPLIGVALNFITRVPQQDKRLYIFMTTFSNVAFMGFPVVNAIYGETGVFFTAIFNLTFNLFVFTFGVVLMSGKSGKSAVSVKSLLNPGIIAAIVAILLFSFKIPVPDIISTTCSTVGSMTTPLAMIVIGSSLATVPLREVFSEYRLYPYTILKQGAAPVLIWLVFRNFITDPMILAITVIVSAMPVAATTVMFSKQYGQDDVKAAKGVFITTLVSIITIPAITMLF